MSSLEQKIKDLLKESATLKTAIEEGSNPATKNAVPAEKHHKLDAEYNDDIKTNIDVEQKDGEKGPKKDTKNPATKDATSPESMNKIKEAKKCDEDEDDEDDEDDDKEDFFAKMKAAKDAKADKDDDSEIEDADDAEKAKVKKEAKKVNVKEDVAALFNGEDGLTEDFRIKAETIFEAAVITRLRDEVVRLEEEYEQKLEEKFDEVVSGLTEHVDGYLNLMVEQWMEQNKVALTSGMKNDILEGFIEGMKNLFSEHYIEVPDEKLDMFEAMEEQIEELNTKLDEATAMNVKIHSTLNEVKRGEAIKKACEGLSDLDSDKFHSLAEELSFTTHGEFATKLQTIRENYFSKSTKKDETGNVFINEEVVLQEKKHMPENMAQYTRALSSLYTKN